jgi:putative flippase GtrA
MPQAHLLSDRWQKFVQEALKFGIVGGVNTVINYGVFNALALTVFSDGQLKATVIATTIAAITSYLMNRHWTYRDRPKSAMRREYMLFFLFNGIGLLIELGVLALAKYGLGITGLLALNGAKTGGVLLGTAFRFWSYRTFVFQSTGAADETGHHLAAELDPVAELAEAVTELDQPEFGPETPAAALGPEAPAIGIGRKARPGPAFSHSIDADLEAELDAELHATGRRPTHR